MSGISSGYDDSAGIYSPEGRVFQVEYAQKAVENSGSALAIKCKDGVVFAVEKVIPSKLVCADASRKTHIIDRHIGTIITGLTADGRFLANEARKQAVDWINLYHDPISTKVLVNRVASVVHQYTIHHHLRPLGVSALVAGHDEKGYSLYCIEPNGTAIGYFACAVGKNKPATRSQLEKVISLPITAKEGLFHLSKIIYATHDNQKDKLFEIELSWICDESNKQFTFVPAELRTDVLSRAKTAAEEEDMAEDSD